MTVKRIKQNKTKKRSNKNPQNLREKNVLKIKKEAQTENKDLN